MKKMLVLSAVLALTLMAGVANADLLNGDFETSTEWTMENNDSNSGTYADADRGWLAHIGYGTPKWWDQTANGTNNDYALRGDRNNGVSSRYFVQLISSSNFGDSIASIDYEIQVNASDTSDLGVHVYGITGNDFTWESSADFAPIAGTATVTELVNVNDTVFGNASGAAITFGGTDSAQSHDLSNTDTSGYDYIMVVFNEGDGSAGFGIDNVTLVPEPATMSLLAIGGIGMLVRRRRRRA